MRIGIDYRPALLGSTGVGRYVRELVHAMAPLLKSGEELVLFGHSFAPIDRSLADRIPQPVPGAGKVTLKRRRVPGRLLDLAGRLGIMSVESFTGPLDLFHYTDLTFPPLKRSRHSVMIHDLAYIESESYHGAGFGKEAGRRLEPVAGKASAVIVPSEATASRLGTLLPLTGRRGEPPRIDVIPHGFDHLLPLADPDFRKEGGAGYFLVVGTLEPRKNQRRVVEAFEIVSRSCSDLDLVLAGKPGWLYRPVLDAVARSPVKERIRLVSSVGDRELARLYQGALGLVYPSLSEGFGLPVAEALSLGCPVITSNRSSLPEVAGDAAILLDPEDVDAMAGAMELLVRDKGLREDLSSRGSQRAKERTWAAAAGATLDLFREIVSSSNPDPGRPES